MLYESMSPSRDLAGLQRERLERLARETRLRRSVRQADRDNRRVVGTLAIIAGTAAVALAALLLQGLSDVLSVL